MPVFQAFGWKRLLPAFLLPRRYLNKLALEFSGQNRHTLPEKCDKMVMRSGFIGFIEGADGPDERLAIGGTPPNSGGVFLIRLSNQAVAIVIFDISTGTAIFGPNLPDATGAQKHSFDREKSICPLIFFDGYQIPSESRIFGM